MIRVSSEIIPRIGNENVIFEIDSDHFLSSSVFHPEDVKKINDVISIKTVDGVLVDIQNETKDLADRNYETLRCVYQYISGEFQFVKFDEKQLGIRVNKNITFLLGKIMSIKKNLDMITVRTTRNEVLVLVHKEKELCDNNFNFVKGYL